MALEITVPVLGESVTEATVAKWLKKVGDAVALDEPLLELETDKVTLEVNATQAGTLFEIVAGEGDTVEVGALLGTLSDGGAQAAKPAPAEPAPAPAPTPAPAAPAAAPAATQHDTLSPAVRKLIDDNKLTPSEIQATGKDGRLTKEDVLRFLESRPTQMPTPAPAARPAPAAKPAVPAGPRGRGDQEERVRMTRLRQRIAERLKDAQNTAAMLTTFNEVDMTNLLAVRNSYKDVFEKTHGVKLGFMSFFVKAAIAALQETPAVNAEIEGSDIIYKNYYDIGVAVGTPSGLVVPVVRDADKLNFAGVEKTIGAYGKKARDGKLSMEDL